MWYIFKRGDDMLGARIAALRLEKGLSQAELAERLKISPSAVGMYEQGRREPSAGLLVALAGELGVSTDFLLTGLPGPTEAGTLAHLLERRLNAAETTLHRRNSLSRQELAVMLAAMLIE